VLGVAAAVGLFLLAGRMQSPALQAVATGITAYGLVYSLVHDGLVHQRWPLRWTPRGGYLQRLVQAHRLHHAVRTREGAVAFGFLIVPAPRRLAAQLRARRQGEAHEARARGTHAA
jgi:beta-carotene 3-hydroxylase